MKANSWPRDDAIKTPVFLFCFRVSKYWNLQHLDMHTQHVSSVFVDQLKAGNNHGTEALIRRFEQTFMTFFNEDIYTLTASSQEKREESTLGQRLPDYDLG